MAEPAIQLARDRGITIEIIPLGTPRPLPGQVGGVCAAEAWPGKATPLYSGFIRPDTEAQACSPDPAAEELVRVERDLRAAALSGGDRLLLGLFARSAVERSSGVLDVLGAGSAGAGIHQLMRFPITRFNGVALPPGSRIRFADPARWFHGGMESRLFSISVDNTSKYFAWDAHSPVGKTVHDFFHVNQKGMFSVFGQADHAGLSGAAVIQAKQLRYLKIGGRVFLVVGVVVDTFQMASAGVESYQKGSARPIAAQGIRTVGGWAFAWAGAKAGIALGAAAGVETGPGVVLTAVGGGLVGGLAGYFGADWIADFVYEN